MITLVRECPCEPCTRALGLGLAGLLRGGDALALTGDLGAGKTTLTRAIVQGMGGHQMQVSSPTFVIINQYPLPVPEPGEPREQPPRRIAHIDAYRLSGNDDHESLGWDRYFDSANHPLPDVLAIIEWPERLGSLIPPGAATISIQATGAEARRFAISFPPSWLARPATESFLERAPVRCRVTGEWVSPLHPTYPFASARARDADLHRWFSGDYRISRSATSEDFEQLS